MKMLRHRNTDANGRAFSPAVIQAVWDKVEVSAEHAPLKVDAHGAVIWREAFGNNNSKLGWEIRHRVPVEQGGGDDLDNLEAIQWENHRHMEAESTKEANKDLKTDPAAMVSVTEPTQEATGQELLPTASAA